MLKDTTGVERGGVTMRLMLHVVLCSRALGLRYRVWDRAAEVTVRLMLHMCWSWA